MIIWQFMKLLTNRQEAKDMKAKSTNFEELKTSTASAKSFHMNTEAFIAKCTVDPEITMERKKESVQVRI